MQQFVVGWEHGCRLALPLLRTVVLPLYAFHGKLGMDTFTTCFPSSTLLLLLHSLPTASSHMLLIDAT